MKNDVKKCPKKGPHQQNTPLIRSSHLNICYYHQDLQQGLFQPSLRTKTFTKNPVPSYSATFTCENLIISSPFLGYRSSIGNCYRHLAPSIFRADPFGRWVVTHSLDDSYFHGHIPAVTMNQHLLWYLELVPTIWLPNSTFGSSHIACFAYQKKPTKHLFYTHYFNDRETKFLPPKIN